MKPGLAIAVDNVSKCYHLHGGPVDHLKHLLWGGGRHSEFWALQDVSFEVAKGEAFAIIGRNGQGKSTLLQIIAGTLSPTTGNVATSGRVAALLELGSGFNPEFSGRDNVHLNCAVLGLSRQEIDARFDEIAAFADIGDHLDQPVKEYSSGMMMRLAFSVQIALRPEVLIVDEALSVGDYFFQQKCFGHLRKMRDDGLTLLLVSHDMGTVRNLCGSALFLKQGRIGYVGDCRKAINIYMTQADGQPAGTLVPARDPATKLPRSDLKQTLPGALWYARDGDGTRAKAIRAVSILGEDGHPTTQSRLGDKIRIRIYYQLPEGESAHVSLTFKNRYDQIVSSFGTWTLGLAPCESGGDECRILEFEVDLTLEGGLYALRVALFQPAGEGLGAAIEGTDWLGPFHVQWDYEHDRPPFFGLFGLPVSARHLD